LFVSKSDDTSERRKMDLDVEAVERVEAELDAFVEKRAREKAEANRIEEEWAESERRVRKKRHHRVNRQAGDPEPRGAGGRG
jgi:uncharacterized protein YifE (UPF0438 family)